MDGNSLGLQDEEFWTDPERTWDSVAGRLSDENFSGVFIGAPQRVPLDLRATLPVIAFRAGSYKDVWAVEFKDHALATAVNLDENRLYADYAMDQDILVESLDPDQAPAGYTVSSKSLDLRERLGIPWRPGRYLVTIVMRERISNRVPVQLQESTRTYQDEEVAKFIAAERAKLGPPAVQPKPGKPFPFYQRLDDSPPIPDEVGINMTVDRVIVLKAGAACVLRGAFRLPVLPQEIIKPGEEPADPGPPAPTAIVGISLLVTGAEHPAPGLLRIDAPSYDPVAPTDAHPVVTGHFALDLFREGALARLPQTAFIYAFSGELLVGPLSTGLVTEDRVPGYKP